RPAQGRVLVLSNGNFGERTQELVRRFAAEVTVVSAPWGQRWSVDSARAELEKGDVVAVCAVHNETSAGVANDLGALAPAVRRSGALFLVDGISSLAGLPLPIESWGIDAVVAGSQKGSALRRASRWSTSQNGPSQPSIRDRTTSTSAPTSSRS
ncbi:aminotransferase class V, partial [mine drainage metagenome]